MRSGTAIVYVSDNMNKINTLCRPPMDAYMGHIHSAEALNFCNPEVSKK